MQYHLSPREQKRRRLRLKIKFGLFFLLAGFLLIGIIYVVRISPFFKIRAISAPGLNSEEKLELIRNIEARFLHNAVSRFLGADNFLAWPQKIELANLKFSKVDIDKNIFRRAIVINAKVRERLGIWCYEQARTNADITQINADSIRVNPIRDPRESEVREHCYWFDKEDGLLLEEAPIPEGQLIFKVTAEASAHPKIGDRVLPQGLFNNFKKVLEIVKALNLSLASIEVQGVLQEAKIKTVHGAALIFSLRFDPTTAVLSALNKLLSETSITKIDYIDMTVENKIYLRMK